MTASKLKRALVVDAGPVCVSKNIQEHDLAPATVGAEGCYTSGETMIPVLGSTWRFELNLKQEEAWCLGSR